MPIQTLLRRESPPPNARAAPQAPSDHEHPDYWLRRLPAFRELSCPLWSNALAASDMFIFPAGANLTPSPGAQETCNILLSGSVRVYSRAEDGREVCLYRMLPGDICILSMAMRMTADSRVAEAVAEQPGRVLLIPVEQFQRLLAGSESFRQLLLGTMSRGLIQIMELVSQISFQRLDVRLVRHLHLLSEQRGTQVLEITHKAVANDLGTTREVASRLLKDLERQGTLALGRGRITLSS